MKKISKTLSFGMILVFILTIFTPYSAKADGELVPALSMDSSGNYIVASVKDLNTLRSDIDKGIDYSGKNVELTKDIDISGSQEVPLNPFTTKNTFNGTFDGNFHTIKNYIDAGSGLFSFISKDAIVKNVKIDANITISATNSIISTDASSIVYGLIANRSAGKIIRCSTTGTIENIVGIKALAGIVGISSLKLAANGRSTFVYGDVSDCYSNITFNNKVESETQGSFGISSSLYQAEHCYFYGKFLGQSLDSPYVNPIGNMISSSPHKNEKSCAYDKDVSGYTLSIAIAQGCTTKEMKNKDTYTALGFDFDKTWKIDSSTNDEYPYLNSENTTKIATVIPVDIQVTAEDKTYDVTKSIDDNLKTTLTGVKVVAEDPANDALLSQYNVTVSYSGDVTFWAPTIGDVPLNFDLSKVNLTYDKNDDYKFVLSKALPSTAKLKDTGAAAPTADKEKEQIENAKKAEDILYSKVASKLGIDEVHEFSWSGDKVPSGGTEGSIVFSDADWGVFSAARSGYKGMPSGFYDNWFKSIQTGLQKMKEAGVTAQDVKKTEWEKLVLAITAIGYDPRDIEAYDLIDIISNEDFKSNQTFAKVYAVLALNSYNYPIPKSGNRIDKEAVIHALAKSSTTIAPDGSLILQNTVNDMGIMQYQPIIAYYNPNAKEGDKYYDVKTRMEYEFNHISNAQTYKGSFYGGYKFPDGAFDLNNAWTNAQVYMNLGMAHAKIFDSKYIKNGNTMIDALLEKFDVKNGTTQFDDTDYEPAQICRGIDSLIRDYEGRNSIFDCTDVKDSTVPVNNAILALPDSITSANKTEVEAAKALFDALTTEKQASIKQSTKDKLTKALADISQSGGTNVTGISLDNTSASLKPGETVQLTATIAPDSAVNKKVDWSSSDTSIATVDENGKVTAVKEGTAAITAVSEDNKAAKATCQVTVSNDAEPKPIKITNLTPTAVFNLGDDAKISVKAENNSGKDQNVSLIVALYDNNNKFVNYVGGSQTIKDGDSSTLTNMIKLPTEGLYKLKAFVWDSLEKMNPLSNTIDIPIGSK